MMDKKKLLESILKDMESSGGKLEVEVEKKPKGMAYGQEDDESEEDMGLEVAAEDVLAAIASKDAKALASAIKALVEMCQD